MPSLSRWAWPELAERSAELKAQYLLRCHALAQVSAALGGADLEALVVKGAGLADTMYPVPWERPMSDIDLIVRPRQLRSIEVALHRAGFEACSPADRPLTQDSLEVSFTSPAGAGAVLVELHLGLDKIAPRERHVEAIFERSTELVKYPALRVPEAIDHLLLVVLHLAADDFRHETGFVDLEVLLASGVDLDVMISRARSWRATTPTFVALATMNALRPGLVPSKVLRTLEPGALRRRAIASFLRIGAWPVARLEPARGAAWVLRQTALRDDGLDWARGVILYGARRAVERAAS